MIAETAELENIDTSLIKTNFVKNKEVPSRVTNIVKTNVYS